MTDSELARKHDVVVVTVTHRLNAFGYLWLAGLPGISERFARIGEPRRSRDLVLALEWVRDNIARIRRRSRQRHDLRAVGRRRQRSRCSPAFPAAKGLFHRAIIMSTLADTAVTGLAPPRAVEAAELLLGRLGVKALDADRLLQMPAEQIVGGTDRRAAVPEGKAARPRPATSHYASCRWWMAGRCPRTPSSLQRPTSRRRFR